MMKAKMQMMQQQQLPERLRGHGVSLTDYRAALMVTAVSRFTDLRTSQKLRVTRMVLDAMHVCIPFATLFTEEELARKVQDIRSHVHAKLDAMETRLSDDDCEAEVEDGLNTLLNAPQCNGFTGSRSTYDFVSPGATPLDANDVNCVNTLGFHVTYQLRQRYSLVLELAAEDLASAEPDAIKSLSSLFRADLVKHHMQKSGTDEDVEEAFDSASTPLRLE